MTDLSKVSEREKLKPRREPYWQRLRPGCFVGYRASPIGGAGTWVARAYDEEQCRYRYRALGSFGQEPASARFVLAKQAAESFAEQIRSGSAADEKIRTVEDACRRFAAARGDVADRFRRYVYSDPIAKVPLEKLRRAHVLAWRNRLEETPALVSRRKVGDRVTRPRSPATTNRDMAALRAALGAVLPLSTPNTEAAWHEPLKPLKNAVKRRTLYLSRAQRRALLRNACKEAALFVRALCQLPLRPGAVAALTVANFDKRTRELTITQDKAGAGRRFLVPHETVPLFAKASKGKGSSALLFSRANGRAWNKDSWKQPIAEAARKAKLPPGVTAYTLRHSTITDLVSGGLPLLTIAQISGTSAHMIEKHYGHLVPHSAVDAALGSLAL